MIVRAGLPVLGDCVLLTIRISLVQLAFFSHLSKLNWSSSSVSKKMTETVAIILRFKHSFVGLHFHQLTVFLLDMCMLVELTSVARIALNSGESIELYVERYCPAVVSYVFSLFACSATFLYFFSCCLTLPLVIKHCHVIPLIHVFYKPYLLSPPLLSMP